jgi:glycosyltransferase involved in cell wall biosynthesis
MLATYEAGKGHSFLLQSFRLVCEAIPTAQLLICGYGYEHEVVEVRRMVKFFGLTDHVTLKGFRRDVTALMRQADVLVVPSQAPESFGLTCVEAMANRTPVVATRVGGIPEVVSDGDGGFCVDSNDIRGFASHIIALLNDASFRCEQGRRGELRYARMFSASRMACEYAKQIYEDGEEFAIANDVEN